ncbi:MAG: hypothetical protein PSN34_01985 [Urechidicola sp.]|nr:hypothetical protein [Urechidicola sp.]
MTNKINTYQDLLNAKKELKEEISLQEADFQNNKLIKFASSLDKGESLKGSVFETLTSVGFKDIITSPLGSLLSTYLLSNKVIRKYFIGYTILKETIPYAFQKLKDMANEIEVIKKED